MATRNFTAILSREDDGFVAICSELDEASQGNSIEVARANLREAVKFFLESASPQVILREGLPRSGRRATLR